MTPPTPHDIAPPPIQASVNNKAVFLCDLNGKFIDRRKLFQPTQDFTFFRCPKIEHARAILQVEIDEESSGHPQLIIIHTGTNDLTTTTPIHDFISDISVLITQGGLGLGAKWSSRVFFVAPTLPCRFTISVSGN